MLNLNFTNLLSTITNCINVSPMVIAASASNRNYLIGRNFIVPNIIPVEEKEEMDQSFQLSSVSEKLKDDIIKMTNNIHERNNIVDKALDTYDILRYTVIYMTDSNTKLKEDLNDNQKALVNSVSTLAGFGKIYINNENINIDFYDVNKIKYPYIPEFVLEKDELVDFLLSEQFRKAMVRRNCEVYLKDKISKSNNIVKIEEHHVTTNRKSNNTPCGAPNPIFDTFYNNVENNVVIPKFTIINDSNPVFDNTPNVTSNVAENSKSEDQQQDTNNLEEPEVVYITENNISYSNNMNIGTVLQFEKALKYYIHNTVKHKYLYTNGFYYLYITRDNGSEDWYIIDDGSIMGGEKISILGTYVGADNYNRYVFVDVINNIATTSNIISDKSYLMTPEEVNNCWYDHLYNKHIYHYIDFHNTSFFDTLSEEAKYNFELTLLGVLNVNVFANIRFRFKEFIDATHYTLVSDYQVFKPLPCVQYFTLPETYVANGLEVKVEDINIHVMFNGTYKCYKMELN